MIGHELGHIKYRDTLTMTVTATIAGAISMLAQFGMMLGGGRRDGNNRGGAVGALLAVPLAPLAAMLVQMAISRSREYAADRSSALTSEDPLGLSPRSAKSTRQPIRSRTCGLNSTRRLRLYSLSIRCPVDEWEVCFRLIHRPKTASTRCRKSRQAWGSQEVRRCCTGQPEGVPGNLQQQPAQDFACGVTAQ